MGFGTAGLVVWSSSNISLGYLKTMLYFTKYLTLFFNSGVWTQAGRHGGLPDKNTQALIFTPPHRCSWDPSTVYI